MTRVAVVGLGLIGGSAALAFEARGHDRSPSVRDRARGRGIRTADSLEEAVAGADVIVTAVSTGEAPGLLRELSELSKTAILTDTASLKKPIAAAAGTLRSDARFVAGHPMAGARRHGVEAATADLFRGRPWILVPTPRSDDAAIAAVSELVRSAGASPVILDADRHDRLMTWISHLPLAAAASLARAAAKGAGADLAALAGPGLRDTTRLAGDRLELSLELALADPKALARAIEAVESELHGLSSALRRGDAEIVRRFFEEAAAVRRSLDPA